MVLSGRWADGNDPRANHGSVSARARIVEIGRERCQPLDWDRVGTLLFPRRIDLCHGRSGRFSAGRSHICELLGACLSLTVRNLGSKSPCRPREPRSVSGPADLAGRQPIWAAAQRGTCTLAVRIGSRPLRMAASAAGCRRGSPMSLGLSLVAGIGLAALSLEKLASLFSTLRVVACRDDEGAGVLDTNAFSRCGLAPAPTSRLRRSRHGDFSLRLKSPCQALTQGAIERRPENPSRRGPGSRRVAAVLTIAMAPGPRKWPARSGRHRARRAAPRPP